MQLVLSVLTCMCYLAALALLSQRFKTQAANPPSRKAPILLLWLGGALAHVILVSSQVLTTSGVNLAFFNALSTIMALVAVLVVAASFKGPLENLGLVVLPLASLTVILAQLYAGHNVIAAPVFSALEVHIIISLLAYSLLTIAALQAMVLAVQDHQLHNHHPGGLIRALPPLQWMEHLLFQLIGLGFILLSLALLSGFIFLDDIFAQHLVHKTALSIVAWLVFGMLLWGRWQFGWRGRIAIRWTLAGSVALMLAYFGSKLVLELILGRV